MNIFEVFIVIILFFLHLGLIIYIPAQLITSFSLHKRQEQRFKLIHRIIELSLMLLLVFCFIYVDMSSFGHENHFLEFAVILLISVVFYWLNKFDFGSFNNLKKFTLPFLGTLFWISLFTSLKFASYLPFCWFPLLGLMALAPLFFLLLSISEIHYQTQLDPKTSVYRIIGFGLVPLIVLQLLMNLYTLEPWELIKIFNTTNTNLF
ncbi:MAG: hypothetical protein GQ574_08200 [Crocinitomix sp.]|nr:hypothetical protein [Crocinitomix sp.]